MQGKYTITNARYRNAVHLPESGEGDDLKVGSHDDQTYIWEIEQLSRNAKYLIKSYVHGRYATTYQVGRPGKAYVSAWDRKAQWVIEPVNSKANAYFIIADNKNICWGLEHGLDGASVALLEHEEDTTDENVMWTFEPALVNDERPQTHIEDLQAALQPSLIENLDLFLDSIHNQVQVVALNELATTSYPSVDQSAVRKVLRRLTSTHDDEVKISAARAIERMTEHSGTLLKNKNLKSLAMSALIPLLRSNDINTLNPALTALHSMDENNENVATVVEKSTVPTLVKLLWPSDIAMQINACKLLNKAVANSEPAKAAAIRSGALAALFRLLNSPSKELQDAATELVVSVTDNWQGPGVAAAICVVPVIDRLELLRSNNPNVVIASCNSLSHNKWERRSEMRAAFEILKILSNSDVLQIGDAAKKALPTIENQLCELAEMQNTGIVTPSTGVIIGHTENSPPDDTTLGLNMNMKIWATITRVYDAPGARWLSIITDEVLYTDGNVRTETGGDGNTYKCFRVRNSAGRIGLITTRHTIFESALNKKVASTITWSDVTPGTRWLPLLEGEILYSDGVTREMLEPDGKKTMCFRARNAAGRMGFVQTSHLAFETALDRKIISKINCKHDMPGSRWLSMMKAEMLYTDGVARQERGLDGKMYPVYRARNTSGQIGFVNTMNVKFCEETPAF